MSRLYESYDHYAIRQVWKVRQAVVDYAKPHGGGGTSSNPTIPPEFKPLITGAVSRYVSQQSANPISGYNTPNPMDVEGLSPQQQMAMGMMGGSMFGSPLELLALQASQRGAGMAGAGPTTGQYDPTGEMGLQDWAQMIQPYFMGGGEVGDRSVPNQPLQNSFGGNVDPIAGENPGMGGGPPIIGDNVPGPPPQGGNGGGGPSNPLPPGPPQQGGGDDFQSAVGGGGFSPFGRGRSQADLQSMIANDPNLAARGQAPTDPNAFYDWKARIQAQGNNHHFIDANGVDQTIVNAAGAGHGGPQSIVDPSGNVSRLNSPSRLPGHEWVNGMPPSASGGGSVNPGAGAAPPPAAPQPNRQTQTVSRNKSKGGASPVAAPKDVKKK